MIITDRFTGENLNENTIWNPMHVWDYWILQAILYIERTHGDIVRPKGKQLTKFGRTINALNGAKTTVATFDVNGTVANEVLATDNTVDYVVSSNAGDTETLDIEGHTLNEGILTFVTQEVTLAGQTPVALPIPLARCTRMSVKKGTYLTPSNNILGHVICYDATLAGTVTNGVPSELTAIKNSIAGTLGKNQSEKCAIAISNDDYWIIPNIKTSVNRLSGSVSADFDVEVKELGGVWKSQGLENDLSDSGQLSFIEALHPYFIVPKNSDVRLICTPTANSTYASGRISGILCEIAS